MITLQNPEIENLKIELEKTKNENEILFSFLANDLMKPIYKVQKNTEMLAKKHESMNHDTVQRLLVELNEIATSATQKVDNLLNWTRSKLNQITPIKEDHSLISLVAETIKIYETILDKKGISLQVKIQEMAQIFADAELFNSVLRNLISNAIKDTPSGGTIVIGCDEHELEYVMKVSDSGKGINGCSIRKIFNVNENLSHSGSIQEKGLALDLKICTEFVELNGGKIWVTSEPDQGTTFSFTVPKGYSHIDLEFYEEILNYNIQYLNRYSNISA